MQRAPHPKTKMVCVFESILDHVSHMVCVCGFPLSVCFTTLSFSSLFVQVTTSPVSFFSSNDFMPVILRLKERAAILFMMLGKYNQMRPSDTTFGYLTRVDVRHSLPPSFLFPPLHCYFVASLFSLCLPSYS